MRLTTTLITGLALVLAPPLARAIEEPAYTVERSFDDFELRAHGPRVVAEVTVPGPAEEAGEQGFRLLAGYIFGKNKGDRKAATTAPVTQTAEPVRGTAPPGQGKLPSLTRRAVPAEPTRIAMTAPVTQAAAEGGFVVRFVMPAAHTLATLPEPIDPRVRLLALPAMRVAAIRYSGRWTDENYLEHLAILRAGMAAANLPARGEPVYARYDGPWMPWFLRRNEIWIEVGPTP